MNAWGVRRPSMTTSVRAKRRPPHLEPPWTRLYYYPRRPALRRAPPAYRLAWHPFTEMLFPCSRIPDTIRAGGEDSGARKGGVLMTTHGSVSQWAGVGVYSFPEAARLVGTSTQTVSRWLLGYRFPTRRGSGGRSGPIFSPQLAQIEGYRAIGFLDLVELLFVKAFREEGVTLQKIRRAAREAGRRWKTNHPFCLRRFATDGRTIFSSVVDDLGEEALLELIKSQLAFKTVLEPYLRQLEYGDQYLVKRWWPLGNRKPVCVDPNICFGRPVVLPVPIPTDIIYESVRAEQTPEEVAKWYGLPLGSVRAAIEFESELARKAA